MWKLMYSGGKKNFFSYYIEPAPETRNPEARSKERKKKNLETKAEKAKRGFGFGLIEVYS